MPRRSSSPKSYTISSTTANDPSRLTETTEENDSIVSAATENGSAAITQTPSAIQRAHMLPNALRSFVTFVGNIGRPGEEVAVRVLTFARHVMLHRFFNFGLRKF